MGNCIDNEGGSIIGKGLETNESVLEINLRLNNLGDEGGSSLFGSLHNNKTLRHVNLSGNSLGSHSAKALVTMFESNDSTALETVVITCNSFTDDDEEAIKSCDTALEINPEDTISLTNKAGALIEIGNLDEAQVCLTKSIDIDATDVDSWYQQARILAKQNKIDDSLDSLLVSVSLDNTYKEIAKSEKNFSNLQNTDRFKKIIS